MINTKQKSHAATLIANNSKYYVSFMLFTMYIPRHGVSVSLFCVK